MTVTNYDDAAYSALLNDANRDDRIGDHDWQVTQVVQDTWPSGDARYKFKGVLLTANSAKADLTLSPPPPPEVVAAESKTWERGKKKAVAQAVTMLRILAASYGKGLDDIAEGDIFRVTTAKTKEEDGKGGFIRVVAFHAKDKVGAVGQQQANVPF